MADLIAQAIQGGMTTDIQDMNSAMMADKSKVLFFPHGDQGAQIALAIEYHFGTKQVIQQPRWSWFEEDWQIVPFTVDNTTVSPVSGLYTVTLPTSEIDAATGNSFPAVRDIWTHLPSNTNFEVISKPAENTLVLKPVLAATAGTVTLLQGDKFMYTTETNPENGNAPTPKYYFQKEYTVGTQNVEHSVFSSGNSLYNKMWFDQTESGVATPFSNSRDVYSLERLHNQAFANSFITNQLSDNLTSSESFNSLNSTNGMWDGLDATVTKRGQSEDTAGDPDVDDFDALGIKLFQQSLDITNYNVLMSGRMFNKISTNLLEYLKQTNIATTNREMADVFFGEGYMDWGMKSGLNTTLAFQYLTYGGINYKLTRFPILDNAQTFAAMPTGGSYYQEVAYFIPQADTTDSYGNLGKFVRILQKPDRYKNMCITGRNAKQNRTQTDNLEITILSEYAIAFLKANQYGRFFNANA